MVRSRKIRKVDMSKKIMLLALAAVSAAMFALPAVASATPNHIDKVTTFSIHGGEGNLSTTDGKTVTCTTTTGNGTFITTTVGTMNLTFHGCSTVVLGFKVNCTSTNPAGGTTGTIKTTPLGVDLITIDGGGNGVLVTPPPSAAFAHFACAGVNFTVEGNGVIGTLTSPACDGSSDTATVDFNRAAGIQHGHQEHRFYTGVSYDLNSGGSTAAMDTHATITFTEKPRKLECT